MHIFFLDISQAGSIDYFTMVTNILDGFVNTHVGLFVAQAQRWLGYLMIMMMFKEVAWHYMFTPGGDAFDFRPLVPLIFKYLIAFELLTFYAVPFWGLGSPVYRIIPDEMSFIANTISLSAVNTLTDSLKTALYSMEIPGTFNVLGALIYGATWIIGAFVWFLTFGVTVIGYCILGMGNVVGPLFIVWIIVPSWSWLFTGWVRFTLIYAFWRVAAAAFTYVWANAMVQFLNMMFGISGGGDYSLGHFMFVTPVMGILALGFAGCLLSVSSVARDIFSGSASISGSAPVMMAMAAARSVISMVK